MNADLKAKWVAELRGGKRKQGFGALRTEHVDGSHFCCLGVLCDLLRPNEWGHPSEDGAIPMGACHSMPPRSIYDEAELSERDADKLADMNDQGDGFPVIANYIEANL